MKVYIDGKYYDQQRAKISVFDYGLLYGDGVFEGIRAYNGRVFKLKEHIDRLFCSAKAILLTIPKSHAQIVGAVPETCRRNKLRDGYIRLIVTRGVGTLGLNPNRCKHPSVIIIADKIQLYPPELYDAGMEIITVPTTRNLHSAVNPAIMPVAKKVLPLFSKSADKGSRRVCAMATSVTAILSASQSLARSGYFLC